MSWVNNRTVALLFRVRVRDVDCAFKLLRREIVTKLALESDDFFIEQYRQRVEWRGPAANTVLSLTSRACQIFCVRGGLHLVRGIDEAISVQHRELVHRQLPLSC